MSVYAMTMSGMTTCGARDACGVVRVCATGAIGMCMTMTTMSMSGNDDGMRRCAGRATMTMYDRRAGALCAYVCMQCVVRMSYACVCDMRMSCLTVIVMSYVMGSACRRDDVGAYDGVCASRARSACVCLLRVRAWCDRSGQQCAMFAYVCMCVRQVYV